jgi:hypothetical protein
MISCYPRIIPRKAHIHILHVYYRELYGVRNPKRGMKEDLVLTVPRKHYAEAGT